jgi:hypothetical protein
MGKHASVFKTMQSIIQGFDQFIVAQNFLSDEIKLSIR